MQIYTDKLEIQVEGIDNDLIIEKNEDDIILTSKNEDSTGLNVWVDVTAEEFINNFSVTEILDSIEFSDIHDYVIKRLDDEDQD